MNSRNVIVRHGLAVAGSAVLAAGAFAPNASAWTGTWTSSCTGTAPTGGGPGFAAKLHRRWGATILSPRTKNGVAYSGGTMSALPIETDGTKVTLPNPAGSGFGYPSPSSLDCENLGGSMVRYSPVGTFQAFRAWHAEPNTNRDGTQYFLTTDRPLTPAQQMRAQYPGTSATVALETLPVAQFAVALIVRIPDGCTATGRAARLTNIEKVLWGEKATWGDLLPGKLTPSSCYAQPVVRLQPGSGSPQEAISSNYAVRRTLNAVDNRWTTPIDYTAPENDQSWPFPVAPGTFKSYPGAATDGVKATPGSISTVDLATARVAGFDRTLEDGMFWLTVNVPLKNGAPRQRISLDPALPTGPGANCGTKRLYHGVPSSTKGSLSDATAGNWFGVDAAAPSYSGIEYPFCNLLYVVALNKYNRAVGGSTQARARTVADYANYIVGTDAQRVPQVAQFAAVPKKDPAIADAPDLRQLGAEGAARIDW